MKKEKKERIADAKGEEKKKLEAFYEKKEELLKLDQIERCSELFQEIVDNSTLDKILYDSSVETPEDVISKIKQIINK
jgi:hypothetical protein